MELSMIAYSEYSNYKIKDRWVLKLFHDHNWIEFVDLKAPNYQEWYWKATAKDLIEGAAK